MATVGSDFGLKLLKVVGAQAGVTYLSAPITTGYRDLQLMREFGVTKQELRDLYPKAHRERVIGPNEREAHKFAQMVRNLGGRGVVINPGELLVPDWSQRDYMQFWEETIRSYCLEVVLAPGWEFSAGARYEAAISLQTLLKISDIKGGELTATNLQEMDKRARTKLLDEGFSLEVIDDYIPWIDFVGSSANPADFGQNVQAFSDIIVRHSNEVRGRQQQNDLKKNHDNESN